MTQNEYSEKIGAALKDARPILLGGCLSMLLLVFSMITYGDMTFPRTALWELLHIGQSYSASFMP